MVRETSRRKGLEATSEEAGPPSKRGTRLRRARKAAVAKIKLQKPEVYPVTFGQDWFICSGREKVAPQRRVMERGLQNVDKVPFWSFAGAARERREFRIAREAG